MTPPGIALPDGIAALVRAVGYPYLSPRVRHRTRPDARAMRGGTIAGRYLYTDLEGEPRFEVLRVLVPGDAGAPPEKTFLSRRPVGGGWAWGLDGVELLPYRLPAVAAAARRGGRIFVVEGEKDVEALEAAGLTATCNPLGALQWRAAYSPAFQGAEVVIVPDSDPVGRLHAARVALALHGHARSVAVLPLPGLGPREDASDWLARGGTARALDELADAAPRDLPERELAALLKLPPDAGLLGNGPARLRVLLTGAPPAAPDLSDGAFPRTRALFPRLGATDPLARAGTPELGGLPAPHAFYLALLDVLRQARPPLAALLEDASLLERSCHELSLFAPLVRAGAYPADAAAPATDAGDAPLVLSPAARIVRTRWDWDAFLADPAGAAPRDTGAAYLLHLPPSGALQVRRLQPFPALLLEIFAHPRTAAQAADEVARRAEGDPVQIEALVRAQAREMGAAGVLRAAPGSGAEDTVRRMREMLLADEGPAPAVGAAGVLARAAATARTHFRHALDAEARGDPVYHLHQVDLCADILEEVLSAARLRPLFARELDGYWRAGDADERMASLRPLLDALGRALTAPSRAAAPYVLP